MLYKSSLNKVVQILKNTIQLQVADITKIVLITPTLRYIPSFIHK